MLLGGDVAYSFPLDPSVELKDIPVILEVTLLPIEIPIDPQSKLEPLEIALGNIFFHGRQIIVIIHRGGYYYNKQ